MVTGLWQNDINHNHRIKCPKDVCRCGTRCGRSESFEEQREEERRNDDAMVEAGHTFAPAPKTSVSPSTVLACQ